MKQVIENVAESNVLRISLSLSLLLCCLFASVLYVYFVNRAIFQAAGAKNLSTQIGEMTGRLNLLQEQYLGLQEGATLSMAKDLGLLETEAQRFISRKTLGIGLSLEGEM